MVPIPKPGKDLTDLQNYRPISLTSSVCKLYEKMVNKRLVESLERNRLLAEIQCGFRRNRATLDNLVRLDTYIRRTFAQKKEVVAVFFDLEKAYDPTWRYGILRDLPGAGLRGRLPIFVKNFLSNRVFKVRVGTRLSDVKRQMSGVPQDSTLRVTLFAAKIDSLVKVMAPKIFSSLSIDDLLIAFSDHSIHNIEKELQHNINHIYKYTEENEFKFSI